MPHKQVAYIRSFARNLRISFTESGREQEIFYRRTVSKKSELLPKAISQITYQTACYQYSFIFYIWCFAFVFKMMGISNVIISLKWKQHIFPIHIIVPGFQILRFNHQVMMYSRISTLKCQCRWELERYLFVR